MIVWRMQDIDGRGPWRPGFSSKWVEDKEVRHLPPWTDEFDVAAINKAARPGTAIGCGCRSLSQLRLWFTSSEYARLVRYGYQAVQMSADRILAESQVQCVFQRTGSLREFIGVVDLYDDSVRRDARRARA